ncbi:hypothetical protein KGF57_001238 [Candida theae]|uniref:Spindle pole body component 110 n=1 Tax=Candida theae TaxID=1198502 RepID=A0AAD5BHF4_9ASCO|nr:uncharacterized protein KGF57_001238 [Candida theae]KAI5963862.1 hypothetical protein KGF57_001238 [Candida theae]
MASVDFTPIGKRRPNTKFQVIRNNNVNEKLPASRSLLHALKDSTNINHDVGDSSFDYTAQEWEDDLKRQTPVRPYKRDQRQERTPRQETVFENIGLGVNQSEETIRQLEAEALAWKTKYRELFMAMEQMGGDSTMIDTNMELRNELKQMEDKLRQAERNNSNEEYRHEIEHKDRMIRKLIEDMERLEKKLESQDDADNELRLECRELREKLGQYEEKLKEYEDISKLESSEKHNQLQKNKEQITKLKDIIRENEQIHLSELADLKSLLESTASKLEAAEREVKKLRESAADTSRVSKHFNSDIEELSHTNRELRKQLDNQIRKSKQLQDDVESLVGTKQDLLHRVEHEKKRSMELVDDMRHDNKILVDKLDQEKERVNDLVDELRTAQKALEHGKETRKELEALLKEAVSEKSGSTRSNDGKMNELKSENAQLKAKIKELVSHCKDLEEETESLRTALKNKEKTELALKSHAQTLEDDYVHLVRDHDKVVFENEALQREVEKMKRDLEQCFHEMSNFENSSKSEAEKRVSQLLSNEQELKKEIASLSALAIQMEDELKLSREEEQDNRELLDDNRELVRKLREMQRILEDLGISSKEDLEIFESNVRDKIVNMKKDLKHSDSLVKALENELRLSHDEIGFLQDKISEKEDQLKSAEHLLKRDRKEQDSGLQEYLEFQLEKTREDLNQVTGQLKSIKLDHDSEIGRMQTSHDEKVKELKEQIRECKSQLGEYKSQLSDTNKNYRLLTDKLLAYKTTLRSAEDIERVNFYRDSWEYFKQRYRDASLKGKDYKFMYDFAIDQIKNSRFKLNDGSKLAAVGLYPEYVGGSTKPKVTLKGVATLVLATVRMKRRSKYEKNRFEQLNKTRKELEYGRKKFKEIEKTYVAAGVKVL